MNTPASIFPSRALAFAAYFAALGFLVYQLTVQTMLVPLSDFVGADLGVSAMEMTVISAAFLATYACMQIPAGVLLDRFGAVVSRDNLSRTGWPMGAPGRNALDVHMLRLRRRIAPLGLAIRTVRSRGYLLEAGELQMVQPA